VLSYGGKDYTIDPTRVPFTIGRDASCDLTIDSTFASRQHCKILFHNKNFILKDSSTNGTFMRTGGAPPVKLHDSMLSITSNGSIKLGEAMKVGDTDVITFKVNF
jgi:predicted component of type VI protein secretion system